MITINTANYIAELAECKLDLANALIEKGAEVSTDDSFAQLISRVSSLHAGVSYGVCTLTASNSVITLNNVPFVPIKIGIAAEDLIVNEPTAMAPYIVMCAYEQGGSVIYDNESNASSLSLTIVVTEKTDTETGQKLYDVSITAPNNYVFKAYYEYTWVACSEGFEFL